MIKQLTNQLALARYALAKSNPFASFLTTRGKMQRLARIGVAKRALRKEMDKVEVALYGETRKQCKEAIGQEAGKYLLSIGGMERTKQFVN
jgi:hypothetical protein